MATRASVSSKESFWNEQKENLKQARKKGSRLSSTPDSRPNGYRPLSNEHPLLVRSRVHVSQSPTGRHTRTPPARLQRLATPPEHEVFQHHAKVRGSRYGVIPPVVPKNNAFEREDRPRSDGYDSWGEEGSEDEGPQPQPQYPIVYPGSLPVPGNSQPGLQYPLVMYPMMIPIQAPPMATTYPANKDGKAKKRVRYRDTPIYLSSRENTKHTPLRNYHSMRASPQLDYIAPRRLEYDPFNPLENPVLHRYQVGNGEYKSRTEIALEHLNKNPDSSEALVNELVNEFLEDELLPDVLIEAIEDEKEVVKDRDTQMKRFIEEARHYRDDAYDIHNNPIENFLNELVDDVVWEESFEVAGDAVKDFVEIHLEKAAAYDIIMDMATELVQVDGPDIVREGIFDVILEDLIMEDMIEPEVEEESREVALDTLKHYNDKVRKKEIKVIEQTTGDKLVDSFSLDYLLSLVTRQNNTWTEGEYAENLLDRGKTAFGSSMKKAFLSDNGDNISVIISGRHPITSEIFWDWMLTILLEQLFDVGRKRKGTIDNKPLRRLQEKMVTDVAVDVILGELCLTLDEDMGDLDEYETGLDYPENFGTPEHVRKWFEGRR